MILTIYMNRICWLSVCFSWAIVLLGMGSIEARRSVDVIHVTHFWDLAWVTYDWIMQKIHCLSYRVILKTRVLLPSIKGFSLFLSFTSWTHELAVFIIHKESLNVMFTPFKPPKLSGLDQRFWTACTVFITFWTIVNFQRYRVVGGDSVESFVRGKRGK